MTSVEMRKEGAALDAAVAEAVAADLPHEPDVRGWLAVAVHVLPSEEVAVWWMTMDLDDGQLRALAQSLLDELDGPDRAKP